MATNDEAQLVYGEARRWYAKVSNLHVQFRDADGKWRLATPEELERVRAHLDEANGPCGGAPPKG